MKILNERQRNCQLEALCKEINETAYFPAGWCELGTMFSGDWAAYVIYPCGKLGQSCRTGKWEVME